MMPDSALTLVPTSGAARGRPVVVIGYGNPLRGDDGVGWHVAQELQARLDVFGDSELEVIARVQLTPELAETISRAGVVIFVDATTEGVPGEVRHIHLAASSSRRPLTTSVSTSVVGQDWHSLIPTHAIADHAAAESVPSCAFSHHCTPAALVALSAQLYGVSLDAHLFTISGSSFADRETLSPEVAHALPLILAELKHLLAATANH